MEISSYEVMNYSGVFADGRGRTLEIRPVNDPNRPFRISVTLPEEIDHDLSSHPDHPFEIADELKGWICQDKRATEFLRVEAGVLRLDGLGPTLDLIPIGEDELTPVVSIGLYDDWNDDLGLPWAHPLSIYRRVPNRVLLS